jgi:hypothetical protein
VTWTTKYSMKIAWIEPKPHLRPFAKIKENWKL